MSDVTETEQILPVPEIAHKHRHEGRDACQTFHFLAFQWCITQLIELLDAEPALAPTIDVNITSVDGMLGLNRDPGSNSISLFHIKVNPEYAMTTDLSNPPLLARLITEKGEDYHNVFVDGWHRLYRARKEGRESLAVRHVQAHAARAVLMPIYLR